jgi:hypothetical protein
MSLASTHKDGRFPISVASPPGAFLTIPLGGGAANLTPGFSLMSPQTRICLLPDQGLVHHRYIGFNPKDLISKLKLFDLLAIHVLHIDLHCLILT